jgi:hypothetical protein
VSRLVAHTYLSRLNMLRPMFYSLRRCGSACDLHNHGAGVGGGVAPGVDGDVVDGVGCHLRGVDDEKPQSAIDLEKIPQPGEFHNMRRRQNRAN